VIDWFELIATITAVCGFSFDEVSRMTLGQVTGYSKALPNVLPYINAFAEKPEKALTGDAARAVLGSLGVKEVGNVASNKRNLR
tara:strand:+ start:95 stop:346 length:252 start_codon:yes stop_codon:yes gene_type:complete